MCLLDFFCIYKYNQCWEKKKVKMQKKTLNKSENKTIIKSIENCKVRKNMEIKF